MAQKLEKQGSREIQQVDPEMFKGQPTGFEKTDSTTFKTPFLKILQALSPELKKNDVKFVQGAESGMFCNSATQQIYQTVDVIVLKVEHSLVVWRPDRGGFVGRHNKSEEMDVVARKDGLQKWDQDGNEVMDAIEFFCTRVDDPMDMFVLSLSAASFKHARDFATRLRMLKADGKPVNVTWAGVWKLSTVEERNDKGAWYTIGKTPEFLRFITKEERDGIVVPAIEMLKKAETDYSVIDASEQSAGKEETAF